jgi:hypothetical protein
MDEERHRNETLEYPTINGKYKKLTQECRSLRNTLQAVAELLHAPEKPDGEFQADGIREYYPKFPDRNTLNKLVTDVEQTLKRKKALYDSLRQDGLPVEW